MGLMGRPVLRTVGFLPRDDGVAEHTDTFDFGFYDIARPEIQRLSILAEAGNPGHRASGDRCCPESPGVPLPTTGHQAPGS